MTLVEFLKARLDEDEAAAHAASDTSAEHWGSSGRRVVCARWDAQPGYDPVEAATTGDVADHIARHDPARVLREIEAKRRIITAYEADTENHRYPTHDAGMVDGLHWAMQFLALPYADHPDYRQEWAL